MDYKEEYQKALERAKNGLPIDEVFPELKDSDDEKIRKELLEEIEFIIPHDDETDSEGLILPSYHARIDRYKSYLEKQKDQKWSPSEGEMSVLYKLCYIGNQITDEDDTDLTRLYQDLKREYFNGHSFENMFSREKQKEQKPASGNSEKPNNHAEWSEEDEHCIHQLILFCENCMQQDSEAIRCATWLKSLRPQPHWKPSEEQMKWLKDVIETVPMTCRQQVPLESLYADLEKLL